MNLWSILYKQLVLSGLKISVYCQVGTNFTSGGYTEHVAWFKENEKPEGVLVVGDDPDLIKIVVAWTNTAVRPAKKLSKLRGERGNDCWEWLWKNTDYSFQELTAKSGVSTRDFGPKLESLIGNRILYPDGTINSFVQRYLREKVLKLFDAKPKRSSKKRV